MIRTLLLAADPAVALIVKATLIAALGLLAAALARQARAAVRHTILAATFAVLLALPIASLFAPPIRVALSVPRERSLPQRPAARATAAAAQRPNAPVRDSRPSAPELPTILLAVWAIGAAIFTAPIAAGLWQLRSLRRTALPWQHDRVPVLLHEALAGPITCGLLRPAIILPRDAENWAAADLERALVHELEHVRRADWLTQCLSRAVCAVYWFHPLVWMAWRRLTLHAEHACDDAVLARFEPTAYADQLVALAGRLSVPARVPFLAMASRADLSARVTGVLDLRRTRGRAGALSVTLACAAAVVLALTLSPLTVVAAPQYASTDSANIYTTTNLVIVDVAVTDRNGSPVVGLTASDFDLTENGVPQTIAIFEPQQAVGVNYYILGYYTRNHDDPGAYERIRIAGKLDSMAKLDYRQGFYTGARPTPTTSAAPLPPGTVPPVLLLKREAAYSDEARRAKYQGTVRLNVEIDTEGHVTNVRVQRSLGLNLDEQAIEAIKQWRFRPAMQNGSPITVPVVVDFAFRLL